MNIRNTLKLKVFESSLPKEDISELITMIESATTVEDIDNINEVFAEKVKEIPYIEAKIIATNENIIKSLKESEIAEELKDVISAMEEYNKDLVKLWEKGTCPINDRQKYIDLFEKYIDKSNHLLEKKTLELKLKYVELTAKGAKSTPEEVEKVKKLIDETLDFKKKVKNTAEKLKDNIIDAAKKTAEVTKSKVDELKDKIAEVKKKDSE